MTCLASNRRGQRFLGTLLTSAVFSLTASSSLATTYVCPSDDPFALPHEVTVSPRTKVLFNEQYREVHGESLRLISEDDSIADVELTIRKAGHVMFSGVPERELEPGTWYLAAKPEDFSTDGQGGATSDFSHHPATFTVEADAAPPAPPVPYTDVRWYRQERMHLTISNVLPFLVTYEKDPAPFVLGESNVDFVFREEASFFLESGGSCDADVRRDDKEPFEVRVAALSADGQASAWSDPILLDFSEGKASGCQWSVASRPSSWGWAALALISISVGVRRRARA